MTAIGTPLSKTATRVMLLGSGELGKEVVIELQRLGVRSDRRRSLSRTRPRCRSRTASTSSACSTARRLRAVIEKERPDLVVPEIEAIATQTLVEMESEGFT